MPIKAVIHHLLPDMPVEDISNNLEDLDFNVVNVRQMTATLRAPNGQTHVEPLPLFLVTLTKNIKSQEIFKLNSLDHIVMRILIARQWLGKHRGTRQQKYLHCRPVNTHP
jgi:hypothetical protein